MPKIYLALYKGRKSIRHPLDLMPRLSDGLTRLFTRGPYSHCEIAVQHSDGLFECYSSSIRDGGVRRKTMPLPSEKWDLIPLPGSIAAHARLQFIYTQTQGRRYDWLGAAGIIIRTRQRPHQWFCSEWCAYVLDYPEPDRISPNTLARLSAPGAKP